MAVCAAIIPPMLSSYLSWTAVSSTLDGVARRHGPHAQRLAALALIGASCALIGCGDASTATGEEGRINYTLYTRYISPDNDLRSVSLITGYDQRIDTDLTQKGRNDTADPGGIMHSIEPGVGASVTMVADGSDVPDMLVNVSDPGNYTLTSMQGPDLFDRITLSFDTPTNIELVTWLRQASGDFTRQEDQASYAVTEGAQVTFLPIPTNDDGVRLLGEIAFDVSVEPATSAVAVHNVEAVYEQSVWYQESPLSLVFIEPGTVTITVSDQVHGDVTGTLQFDVAPIATP